MRREWELEDLIECWTLDEAEAELLANKSGATRLGFALMLKFFELEGRFPRREDVPKAAVDYVAGQVKVDAALFAEYRWSGSTIEYHRAQIRRFHGFREPTVADEDKLTFWLADKICPVETSRERLRAALLTRCREDRTEPPTPKQIERLAGAAEALFEREFTTTTMRRCPISAAAALEDLITVPDPDPDPDGEGGAGAAGARSFLQELKEDPGPLQLETLLAEIVKLERVKAIGLPEELFEGVSEKVVEVWRARAMRMYPSDFAAAPEPIRLTLLAALCWVRKAEMIDGLVELLIQLVHKISVRAERKVENELSSEFRRVARRLRLGSLPDRQAGGGVERLPALHDGLPHPLVELRRHAVLPLEVAPFGVGFGVRLDSSGAGQGEDRILFPIAETLLVKAFDGVVADAFAVKAGGLGLADQTNGRLCGLAPVHLVVPAARTRGLTGHEPGSQAADPPPGSLTFGPIMQSGSRISLGTGRRTTFTTSYTGSYTGWIDSLGSGM
ncbi:DUF4158 domain-containing protein [Nonomuraea dietziae]|uniref:DUF4158 domain-containing protein n=1 Tax=Nonomuraea dietziae TaxID=65515 RepID=A0A7W5V464_9ACTN|nr:DUF4158 domain-containing protein [Nonomuraea dietziae]MBB3724545.1 hypothetical protein [Nonomuraea dietziae]